MTQPIYNILVLCTGNSARSIMAEALINTLGQGQFKAYSAGSQPAGKVNPFAIEQIQSLNDSLENVRSKSWDEFAMADAPIMDFIITVCDNAAGEICPFWPGKPISAHWGFTDPAAVQGNDDEKRQSFSAVFNQIKNRVEKLLALSLETMDREKIQQALQAISPPFEKGNS